MSKAIVIMSIFFLFSSCNNNKSKNTQTKQDNFPWDKRNVLVIYAGNSEDLNPDENTPSLIIPEYNDSKNILDADGVPYLTVLDTEKMLAYLKKKYSKDTLVVPKIETWVKKKKSENFTWFFYELEPPELVGKAYPLAIIAEKAEANKDTE